MGFLLSSYALELLIPILSVVGTFTALIVFIYMRYRSRHIQNMALIETGQSSDILKQHSVQNYAGLRFGLLLIGVGIGIFLGMIVQSMTGLSDGEGVVPMAMIGGGAGLVFAHMMVTRMQRERDELD